MKNTLFNQSNSVVFKPDDSRQGAGIKIIYEANFNVEKLKLLGNGLFQSYINQHDFFSEFTNKSVATLRITTTFYNDKVEIRSSYLRLGIKNDTHIQSSSAIKVIVDPLTGQLNDIGHTATWRRIESHPDNKIFFSGKHIPSYQKCVDLVKNLHRKVPYVRSIGWDVIIDNLGEVKVMEWNGAHNGIKYSESIHGPCFIGLGWENLWKE